MPNATAQFIRRRALAAELGDTPALIAAGAPSPRNYRANAHPFRAASHFLYLVGAPFEHAYLLFEDDAFTLFAPAPAEDDALWHGPTPTLESLSGSLGLPVLPSDALEARLRGRAIATVPAIDLGTCAEQSRLLGRPISPGTLTDADARLADALITLRLRHDEASIAEMRAASAITDRAHRAGMAATRAGMRESDIRAAIEREMLAADCEPAYGSIVTVHGEVLHNHHHTGMLADGDLLLADCGSESRGGWASDVTRTWPVSGRYSETQARLYDVVLASQRAAIEATRPGARYRDIHLVACRTLTAGLVELGILRGDPDTLVADGVHALFFPHGVGHLIGLDVHDMEDLGDRAGYAKGRTRSEQFGLSYLRLDRDLEPGMAVTIEPGFYQVPALLEGPLAARFADRLQRDVLARYADVRGIRIEDDVLVTETGHDVLTAAIPKSRDEVERAVAGASSA